MLPQVLLVVLGEQCVQEGVDAAVGVGQAGGQVVDVALGFGGEGQRGVELAQELPDPERQEARPEEEHDGEDQVEHLWRDRTTAQGRVGFGWSVHDRDESRVTSYTKPTTFYYRY